MKCHRHNQAFAHFGECSECFKERVALEARKKKEITDTTRMNWLEYLMSNGELLPLPSNGKTVRQMIDGFIRKEEP